MQDLFLRCSGFYLVVVCRLQSTWAQKLQHVGSRAPGLSFLARDRTHIPCIGRQILNHWTTREIPIRYYLDLLMFLLISLLTIPSSASNLSFGIIFLLPKMRLLGVLLVLMVNCSFCSDDNIFYPHIWKTALLGTIF